MREVLRLPQYLSSVGVSQKGAGPERSCSLDTRDIDWSGGCGLVDSHLGKSLSLKFRNRM